MVQGNIPCIQTTKKDPIDNPIDVKEADQAMDFFHGLDDIKYAEFKQNMKNWWGMKSMQPPKTVNEIYRLAGVWVKPTARSETCMAATYHTGARKQEKPKDDNEGNK
jgi:hypothetical protein